MSSSRRSACSAVTMTPLRQMTPVDEPRASVWTATALAAARSVACARALDTAIREASTSTIWLGSDLERRLGEVEENASSAANVNKTAAKDVGRAVFLFE